jgi:O-antigen/teichoic acid export membrane protein
MLKRHIWETLGVRFLVLALGSVGSILLTRSLGPEGRGLYLAVVSLVLLGAQIGTLGLTSSNTYFLNSRREDGDQLASNTLVLGLAVGSSLAVAGWFAAIWLLDLRQGVGDSSLIAGLATIPLSILLLFGQNLLIAKGDVTAFNRLEFSRNLGWVALVLIFAVALEGGVRVVIWLNLLAFTSATLWVWVRIRQLGLAPRLRWYPAVFRRTIGFGLKAYAITLLGFLVLRVDALLVQHWSGSVEGGEYGVAVQLGDLILTIGTTISMLVFPNAAEAGAEAWPLVKRITVTTSVALVAICLVGYALAPLGVRILFGVAFLPAVAPFRILLPGIWMLSVETLLVQYLNGIGMPIAILWSWIVAFAVNIGLNALLIPAMGIEGAAWASTVAYGLAFTAVVALVARDRATRSGVV